MEINVFVARSRSLQPNDFSDNDVRGGVATYGEAWLRRSRDIAVMESAGFRTGWVWRVPAASCLNRAL